VPPYSLYLSIVAVLRNPQNRPQRQQGGKNLMKLGSLKAGGRDGTLIAVSRDLVHGVRASHIAPTLQAALDDWQQVAPRLHELYDALCLHRHEALEGAFELDFDALAAPLPRAYEFLDGSAYLPHVERVRKARGATVPETFYSDPLMYQATSAGFLGPRDPIVVPSEEFGIDLEAEVVIVTDDVPMAVTAEVAAHHIRLIGLVNDVSLRNLIPAELAKGFGFLQSKPRSALSPVLVTPDELRDSWIHDTVHLPMRTWINGQWLGEAEAGEDMQFNFAQLITHAAKTRPLTAGTLIGSGTIANQDTSHGASCLAEQRTVEKLRDGEPTTPFLKYGDTVKIDMHDIDGNPVFGAIEQTVQAPDAGHRATAEGRHHAALGASGRLQPNQPLR
jgi:fumarylacetoacetate (FAA) hydrolase